MGLPKRIFESNTGNLGLLTSDEIKKVIHYYHAIDVFTEELENAEIDLPEKWDEMMDLDLEDLEISEEQKSILKINAIFLGILKRNLLEGIEN